MTINYKQIDKVLPQTQCRECTYQDCQSYAKAILKGERIDRCIPGGIKTLKDIADIVGRDHTVYLEQFNLKLKQQYIVKVRESDCIGCTKCINACPVDAIIGTSKKMHDVIRNECTGCNLCIPACPVDCIEQTNIKPNYSPEIASYRYSNKMRRTSKIDNNFRKISNKNNSVLQLKRSYINKLLKKRNNE